MNLDHHMVDTINIASPTAIGNDADKTYGSKRSIKARVEPIRKLIRTTEGKEIQATHWIMTSSEIKWNDRIWLSIDDLTSNGRRPIRTGNALELNGTYRLYEVYL